VLWRELITRLPSVIVPVELIRALDIAALGVTGQIVLRADDLGHAGTLIGRFMRLTDTAMGMQRLERDGLIGVGITHRPEVVAMRYPIELMVGIGFRLLTHAAGGTLPLREVTFAHPAGYPVAAYEALFGAPVRFEAPHTAMWFPAEALDLPFAGRDPLARRYIEAHAEHMLATLPEPEPAVVRELREAIVLELATSGAELSRVARRVAMSTRTVQRRLDEAGTSFQQLVDDVRSAMARSLLRDHARSILDVAFELGYADLKGFYRAFRRWTGATPAEWRARARGA
jgi:AraC-like DNA-binding protein